MGFFKSLLMKTFIGRWIESYKAYVKKIATSGYVGPTSVTLWNVCRSVFFVWAWIQVGRIRIVGRKYLKTPGRLVFCPNHSSLLDAIVAMPAMSKPLRGIGAYETFYWCGGLVGIVLSRLGSIPVDRSNGKTVLAPAIKVVSDGENLVIFPEGKISTTGELLPFKLGPAYIANAVYEKLGQKEPVSIVPINICYHKRDNDSAVSFWKMGFKWRGGVTITICPPIELARLQDREPQQVMDLVREAISAVSCQSCQCAS